MRVGIFVIALALASCAPPGPAHLDAGDNSAWVQVGIAADSSTYAVDRLSIAEMTYQGTVVQSAWVRKRFAEAQVPGSRRSVGYVLYLQYFACEAHLTAVVKRRYYQSGTVKLLSEQDLSVPPPQLMGIIPDRSTKICCATSAHER